MFNQRNLWDTKADGSVLQRILYRPYGETWIAENGLSNDIERFYTGQVYDRESGLYYYNARYYSPNVGMFITADPAMDGANHYAYAGCNPVMYNDPSGCETVTIDTGYKSNYTYDTPNIQTTGKEEQQQKNETQDITKDSKGNDTDNDEKKIETKKNEQPIVPKNPPSGDPKKKENDTYTPNPDYGGGNGDTIESRVTPLTNPFTQTPTAPTNPTTTPNNSLKPGGGGFILAWITVILAGIIYNTHHPIDRSIEDMNNESENDKDNIYVYHGSRDNFNEIIGKGLGLDRMPVYVSTDIKAAKDAIMEYYDVKMGVIKLDNAGIVGSRIPVELWNKLILSGDITMRSYKGFSGKMNTVEYLLNTEKAIQAFNQGRFYVSRINYYYSN